MRSLLIALMVALAGVLPPGGTFVDDDASAHEGAIEAVAAEGITRGCNPPSNDAYCPEGVVSRGQMAAFLTRALDLEPAVGDWFDDDDGHTFEGDINSLAATGITTGCGEKAFCPERSMTRGEMAAMLSRAFHHPPADGDRFVDDDGHLFERDIDTLAAAGITLGCNPPLNDRFCPDATITRAQMATFLTRALDLDPIEPPDRPHPVVEVRSRESWGALEPEIDLMSPHIPRQMTVHHAGTQTGTTGPAQFRGWQSWHMTGQGWGDIAYHLIIGTDGAVYEGRDPAFEGDTGTTYDTTGHFLVVVEGNFDHDRPTDAQIDSLERVLAWASEEYGIDPSTISGHRDHAATTCPGAHLHSIIESGDLEESVEHLIGTGGVDLVWP